MKKEQIVVTGMGIITALGAGKDTTVQKLHDGVHAIGAIRHLRTKHTDIPVAEVPYSNEELMQWLDCPADKKITRTSLLGRVALREAAEEARLTGTRKRIAFINGNTVGGMDKSEQYYHDFLNSEAHTAYIALHDCGACTDIIAEELGQDLSLTTTISTACSSAANAIILGANLLRNGVVDIAVVGGTECLSAFHFNGFKSLMILDHEPCRPFDANRHGLTLGEGAAYLVMEADTCARERGVTPLCKLTGYGNACDAFHQTATSPEGEGPFLAMRKALEESRLQTSDIDYINAHGTGTPNNDECEGVAMMRIFNNQVPLVSSTKAYTGHTTSAAGGVESVIAILALQHQFVPANLRYADPITQHTFQPVQQTIEHAKLQHVLTNSFGFGGNDSSCIFSTMESETNAPGTAVAITPGYIQAVSHISLQNPLCDDWFDNPLTPQGTYNESKEPNYAHCLTPIAARRMGALQKRAVATAVDVLKKSQTDLPDAIIAGTGLGCIGNTEKFLNAMLDNGEECLSPTFFMQSTHNTIASQVALHLKCHGYNSTYSHRGTSFDSALLDAWSQLQLHQISNALVGAYDEMTPAYFTMLSKIGFWKEDFSMEALKQAETPGSIAGNSSLNMLIANQPNENTMCRIDAVQLFYRPDADQLKAALERILSEHQLTLNDIDALVLGLSGDCHNDRIYTTFSQNIGPEKPILWYKHIFGESFSSSAFGVYAGALALQQKRIPAHLLYNRESAVNHPKRMLVYNHFQNIDHSLILLSECSC